MPSSCHALPPRSTHSPPRGNSLSFGKHESNRFKRAIAVSEFQWLVNDGHWSWFHPCVSESEDRFHFHAFSNLYRGHDAPVSMTSRYYFRSNTATWGRRLVKVALGQTTTLWENIFWDKILPITMLYIEMCIMSQRNAVLKNFIYLDGNVWKISEVSNIPVYTSGWERESLVVVGE